ncbi:hypothetical protein DRN73_03840 [Candidatus Pacearchaeota archaeon]|nr:MAG: hypothetical protein DRN73_03840 [Candidatus Pacearchaeota archaeon]
MVDETEKIDKTIAETIAQLAANYKFAQESSEKAKIEKEAEEFMKDVSNNDEDEEKWKEMYNGLKE